MAMKQELPAEELSQKRDVAFSLIGNMQKRFGGQINEAQFQEVVSHAQSLNLNPQGQAFKREVVIKTLGTMAKNDPGFLDRFRDSLAEQVNTEQMSGTNAFKYYAQVCKEVYPEQYTQLTRKDAQAMLSKSKDDFRAAADSFMNTLSRNIAIEPLPITPQNTAVALKEEIPVIRWPKGTKAPVGRKEALSAVLDSMGEQGIYPTDPQIGQMARDVSDLPKTNVSDMRDAVAVTAYTAYVRGGKGRENLDKFNEAMTKLGETEPEKAGQYIVAVYKNIYGEDYAVAMNRDFGRKAKEGTRVASK